MTAAQRTEAHRDAVEAADLEGESSAVSSPYCKTKMED